MRVVMTLLALFLPLSAARADPWRTYAGGFTSRWSTIGHHGHDQPSCRDAADHPEVYATVIAAANCDAVDFARGNLDDSIGFRAGRERDFLTLGPLHLVGGGDAGVSHTEYNLSQRNFSLISGALFAGADFRIARFGLGARYGNGAFSTTANRQLGGMRFTELTATVPLRRGAAIRVARRNFTLSSMHAAPSRDVSVTLVADGSAGGRSAWEFGAVTGTTWPGAGVGSDRGLSPAAVNRMTAARSLPWYDVDVETSWSSTAHESSLPSKFLGYEGNFRSKTIEGYGVAVSRTFPLTRSLAVRGSAGVEVADWRDEHRLLTRNAEELVAGVEAGLSGAVALRVQIQPQLALETSLQKVYWRSLDLGEVRWTTGIVVTR